MIIYKQAGCTIIRSGKTLLVTFPGGAFFECTTVRDGKAMISEYLA